MMEPIVIMGVITVLFGAFWSISDLLHETGMGSALGKLLNSLKYPALGTTYLQGQARIFPGSERITKRTDTYFIRYPDSPH